MTLRSGMRFRAWAPVFLWVLVIWTMSGDPFSAEQTGGWIAAIFRLAFPDIQAETVQTINAFARKLAHVIEYAILGVLARDAFRRENPAWSGTCHILGAVLLGALCASADEVHQAWLAARTGSCWDALLDVCASVLGAAATGNRSLREV